MEAKLRFEIFLFFIFILFVIIKILKKDRMPIKYSLVWISSSIVMLIIAVFPKLLQFVANILGFGLASNMILSIFLGLLIFITISLTIIVSGQKKKLTLLIQEVSMLKEKVNMMGKK